MRSLNLDQLRAFVEVVERGSFTRAATQLNLSQPAVTHQVQELERRFETAVRSFVVQREICHMHSDRLRLSQYDGTGR